MFSPIKNVHISVTFVYENCDIAIVRRWRKKAFCGMRVTAPGGVCAGLYKFERKVVSTIAGVVACSPTERFRQAALAGRRAPRHVFVLV
ncbi:hypothetical protein [Massilia sp. KIM]|uniref:hypothetical protein n=1 Tax=Massilia sp. KIM TaxID=1955422 RepID=UPI0011808633|nr:hypothetical protein [Massilia sp. KIM]